jgi:predicted glycoside hydrolase/deacetylase ChbG (UPF0249 family)
VKNIRQSPGYSTTAKLLIIHADDLGMCRSVNHATLAALEEGTVSSASVMVPCPAFAEAAERVARHPEYDIGIHSTLISEWKGCKWGPISNGQRGTGLADESRHFWPRNAFLRASPQEIEDEIFAQITLAKQAGVDPTHLDSHTFSVARPEYIATYINLGRRFGLPFLIDSYWHSYAQHQDAQAAENDVVVDEILQANAELPISSLEDYYLTVLRELKPGLSQIIVHLGFDDPELRTITQDQEAFGAAWRQRDFEILSSNKFKSALRENDIQIINWRMIHPLTIK